MSFETGLRQAQSLLRMSGKMEKYAHPEERLRSRAAASRRRVSKDGEREIHG